MLSVAEVDSIAERSQFAGVVSVDRAGEVYVLFGSSEMLRRPATVMWQQSSPGVKGRGHNGVRPSAARGCKSATSARDRPPILPSALQATVPAEDR
jgi:hypothetical protein